MEKTIRVIISGRVQGVAYRAWTVASAEKLGIHGWVRNLTDGTVEAVFSGEESLVDTLLKACESGPPAARVRDIQCFSYEETVGPGFTSRATV